jgi:hypothetical protein
VKGLVRIVLLIALFFMLMCGCNHKAVGIQTIPLHDSVNTAVSSSYIHEDIAGKPDSAIIRALLQCDSLGNIYIKTIAQLQGNIVNQSLSLNGNNLSVAASSQTWHSTESTRKDSVRIVYKDKPVPYPVETITNRLTSWQSFQIWIGRLVLIGLVLFLTVKLVKSKFSWIKTLFKR